MQQAKGAACGAGPAHRGRGVSTCWYREAKGAHLLVQRLCQVVLAAQAVELCKVVAGRGHVGVVRTKTLAAAGQGEWEHSSLEGLLSTALSAWLRAPNLPLCCLPKPQHASEPFHVDKARPAEHNVRLNCATHVAESPSRGIEPTAPSPPPF